VAFEQVTPLGDLSIRWSGDGDDAGVDVSDEFDLDLVPGAAEDR
jgi:segregation and condensation protein A